MPVITIEGRVGAGGDGVGRLVAKALDLDFVDRLLLAEIGRRVGATVEAVQDSERRLPSRGDRFISFIQRTLERTGSAGAGDPYFGPGMEVLISRPYRDFEAAPATRAEELHEQQFIDTTADVIREIAAAGDAVILSRGGGAILRDTTGVLRVGLLGESEDRATRIQGREQLPSLEAARELIEHSDSAQARYFEKAFESNPVDPFLYHFMINTSEVSLEYAAGVIIYAARQMDEQGLLTAEHEALESEEPLTVPRSSN